MGSSRHIHLDAVGGAAGDMFVAAMLDAFPELHDKVFSNLSAVLPSEAGSPHLYSCDKSGLSAKRFELTPINGNSASTQRVETYIGFRDRILKSSLPKEVAVIAHEILLRIARAEAEIHGISIDHVHFHELADWDTLADIIAAASLINGVGESSWSISPLPLGGGLAKTAHGLLPIPAPATALLLRGYDWRSDGIDGERVTPTGAAIVAHVTGGLGSGSRLQGRLSAIGTGAGTRDLSGIPNILRISTFEACDDTSEAIVLLNCDIDDMTGEEIATAATRLREAQGVLDVTLVSALGKKGRPVTKFEIQCAPMHSERVVGAIFAETSTLGIRKLDVLRHALERQQNRSAEGLRSKTAVRPGGDHTTKAEQDDLEDIAGLAKRRQAARLAEK